MNNRALTLSLVMGALAVFFVWSYVTSIEEDAKKKFGTEVLVVTARRDIKEMETITETMLEFKLMPKKFLEPASVSLEQKEENKDSIKTIKALAGTIAVVPIKQGEQLTYNKITEPSMRTGLSNQVAPNRRAIALPVDETSAVAKLVKPGDRVDVITIIDPGVGKEGKLAKTLLQDAVVLSVGRYITNNAARTVEVDTTTGKDRIRTLAEDFTFASVTIEVDPTQAQILALVLSSADNRIVLSLRNNDDVERVNLPTAFLADVLGPDYAKAKQLTGKK